jgi:hypothetical protein
MCQSAKCGRKGDIYDLRNEKPNMDKGQPVRVSRIDSKPPPRAPDRVILADKAAVVSYCAKIGHVVSWHKYDWGGPLAMLIAKILPPGKPKTFRQFTPCTDGYVVGKDGKSGHPIYKAELIAAWPTILVCEGEGSVEAAWACGIPAVTSNGGAKNPKGSDWSALRGKTVVLWPDNDEPGQIYMDSVTEILSDLECVISRIDVSKLELPPHGDIADMAAKWPVKTQAHTDVILALMDEAEPVGALAELRDYQRQVAEGKWKSLDSPLRELGAVSRAFLPGAITVLCADPGAGKSFFLLQLMAFWYAQGIVAHARLFEDERFSHMARLLAQLTGQEGHTRCEWMEANGDQVVADTATHSRALSVIGSRVIAEAKETSETWTADVLCKWAEAKAASGSRVIIVDPLTGIAEGDKSWQQDFEVVMRLKATARKHGCSILLTTHPRKETKQPSMSAMSGGTAWSRFSHTILWLERHDDQRKVNTTKGAQMANRTINVLKCRNGKGAGCKVALRWGEGLQLHELGLIVPDPPRCAIAKEAAAMEKTRRATKYSTEPQQNEDLFS